eukprot:364323-Chlamydomonas_euryale.AAC.9
MPFSDALQAQASPHVRISESVAPMDVLVPYKSVGFHPSEFVGCEQQFSWWAVVPSLFSPTGVEALAVFRKFVCALSSKACSKMSVKLPGYVWCSRAFSFNTYMACIESGFQNCISNIFASLPAGRPDGVSPPYPTSETSRAGLDCTFVRAPLTSTSTPKEATRQVPWRRHLPQGESVWLGTHHQRATQKPSSSAFCFSLSVSPRRVLCDVSGVHDARLVGSRRDAAAGQVHRRVHEQAARKEALLPRPSRGATGDRAAADAAGTRRPRRRGAARGALQRVRTAGAAIAGVSGGVDRGQGRRGSGREPRPRAFPIANLRVISGSHDKGANPSASCPHGRR